MFKASWPGVPLAPGITLPPWIVPPADYDSFISINDGVVPILGGSVLAHRFTVPRWTRLYELEVMGLNYYAGTQILILGSGELTELNGMGIGNSASSNSWSLPLHARMAPGDSVELYFDVAAGSVGNPEIWSQIVGWYYGP